MVSRRHVKKKIVLLPDIHDEEWEREITRDEEVAVAESLYGFDNLTAKRLAFQRWYRKHVTGEAYLRDPVGLWYPPISS